MTTPVAVLPAVVFTRASETSSREVWHAKAVAGGTPASARATRSRSSPYASIADMPSGRPNEAIRSIAAGGLTSDPAPGLIQSPTAWAGSTCVNPSEVLNGNP